MPSGVYIRTEKHKKNLSIVRKRLIKENPEKDNLKNAWENDRERMLEAVSRAGKIGGKISRTNAWKNDRKRMLKRCSKAGKIGGKRAWENSWINNREEMIERCRMGGRVGGKINGGIAFKRIWRNNREEMLKQSSKFGKIGGPISIRKQQKTNLSPIELIVRDFLDKLKIKHQNNVWFPYNGTRKEADIVVLKYNLIIECDGWAHVTYEKVKQNDKLKNKLFKKLGYNVLRLTGIEIRNGSYIGKFLNKIRRINIRGIK